MSWLPVAACTVGGCVRSPARTAGPVRRALRVLGALGVVAGGVSWSLVARRFDDRRRGEVTMRWARLLLRVLGIRLEVAQGFSVLGGSAASAAPVAPGAGTCGALLVANHVSWLDPLVVAAITPCRPLAKSDIARWPVLGSLVASGGAIFIDRERLSTLPGTVRDVAGALRAGHDVAVFPEGTTTCGRAMGPFRPAMFQAAIDAGAPVRPVRLRFRDEGSDPATGPAFVGDDTLPASLRRVIAARGLVVEVTMFPQVAYAPAAGVTRRSLAGIAHATVSGDAPRRHDVLVAA
ncbi:1-acyl-sn-glycerol-3-phosphate acyltransferase [Sphaerisporangium siamense]|uniref:1-acyl-sn-glycerol-3-phosphate acyltransferase n=1 Tax=Sphaerisporangium siamense TaxID=795645 RepID=A0A7W7G607_9ACTN|nr:lysophospholipid acyltransferase family protein [Sphaerisporangium siamense]MBB4699053.1 1-acyl-sn-glycerol-3-phosphate acyltransferase [Sphaerisporangium siamense]GII86821.1 1-acyl-sn-glycerol-3-phosphate acyltransferase [Sphaerisporangium siamense]